jgi:hypothetical protein
VNFGFVNFRFRQWTVPNDAVEQLALLQSRIGDCGAMYVNIVEAGGTNDRLADFDSMEKGVLDDWQLDFHSLICHDSDDEAEERTDWGLLLDLVSVSKIEKSEHYFGPNI